MRARFYEICSRDDHVISNYIRFFDKSIGFLKKTFNTVPSVQPWNVAAFFLSVEGRQGTGGVQDVEKST